MLDVLFVDDEAEACKQVSAYLRQSGLSVETVSNTFAAIRRLEQGPVLVVIADEVMRGPSGTSLLLTVEQRWPKSGRILYSGNVTPELRRQALGVGALLLVKGEDPKDFRHAIIAEVQDAEDDISRLYEKAEATLKAKRAIRQDTLVDVAGPPPPAEDSTPKPPARVPRPEPKAEPRVPLPAIELDSLPTGLPRPTPLPSTFPESEAPTKVDGTKRRLPRPPLVPTPTPSIHVPLDKADEAAARRTREWHPPGWLVALAKWVAPPVMLCLMAVAYWFQARVALDREQADALSEIRKKKDADAVALQKSYAESQAKLGLAQAERDAALAQAAREHFLCTQSAVKVIKEDKQ